MVRRSRLEIYFEILDVVNKGVEKPTRIMYKTNLSWITLNQMFDTLISGGFISEINTKNAKRYHITEKGQNALSYYRRSLEGLIEIKPTFSR